MTGQIIPIPSVEVPAARAALDVCSKDEGVRRLELSGGVHYRPDGTVASGEIWDTDNEPWWFKEEIESPQPDHDPVNHPKHYTAHPSGVECIEVTRHMSFNLGNVVKYVWRSGLKDEAPSIQDLKKAAWYLNDEIEKRKKEEGYTVMVLDEELERQEDEIFHPGPFDLIAHGAFKYQVDVPFKNGTTGEVLGKCEVNPDGTINMELNDRGIELLKEEDPTYIGCYSIWVDPQEKEDDMEALVNTLQEAVDKNIFVDITTGAEKNVGVSRKLFLEAVGSLVAKGYLVWDVMLSQADSEQFVKTKVLCGSGITQHDVYRNRDKIVGLLTL